MKSRQFVLGLVAGIAAVVCVAAMTRTPNGIWVNGGFGGEPKLQADQNDQTADWIQFRSNGVAIFEVPASGILPIANGGTGGASASASKTALGIQSGFCITTSNGTVTNTFTTAFSAAPIVVVTARGAATLANTTNAVVISASTTGFLLDSGIASQTNNWIAVGAP